MNSSPVMLPNSQKPYRPSYNSSDVNLPESALFDKIINVSIHRKGKPDLVIRSDYEIIGTSYPQKSVIWEWEGNHNTITKTSEIKQGWYIQRCTYKPSIQLKFTVLTQALSSDIDLLISNFYVFTGDGAMSLYDFTGDTYPITGVDIIMGYAAQFPKPQTPEEFFDVNADRAPAGTSALRISSVSYSCYDKAPPNSVFRIHGYIADAHKLQVSEIKPNENIKLITDPVKSKLEPLKLKNAEDLFYQLIERRFIRDNYAWKVAQDEEKAREEEELINKQRAVDNANSFWGTNTFKVKPSKKRYIASDGYLDKEGAAKFGCKVIIPEGSELKEFWFNYKHGREMTGTPPVSTAKEIGVEEYLREADTVPATLDFIKNKFFPKLKYVALLNGNYVVWNEEDLEKVDKKDYVLSSLNKAVASQMPSPATAESKGFQLASSDIQLPEGITKRPDLVDETAVIIPAVYDISVAAGDTIIKCPYFSLLNPFSLVAFNSRYNLTDFSSYFASKKANAIYFYTINYSVDFSTTGKENMVTILGQDATERNKIIQENMLTNVRKTAQEDLGNE